jgi:hypothetical protein
MISVFDAAFFQKKENWQLWVWASQIVLFHGW